MIEISNIKKGFTLIELIVVFSTIAFLSIVGITSYRTYSESQSLASSAQELVTTIQLARSRASSQVKPPAPKCKQVEALDGYSVEILTNIQYKLGVVCSDNSYELQTTTLPNNIKFDLDQDKTTTRKVFFAVITGRVIGGGTIAITGYNQTKYIIVDSVGIAHLSLSPPPTPTPTPLPTKRVFVTGWFSGGLLYNGNLGGLTGGDAKCQTRADAASLGGRWIAWLSTSAEDAKDRVPNAQYIRLDNVVVARNRADLINGTLEAAINVNEKKTPIDFNTQVWTGTNNDGIVSTFTCVDWASSSNSDTGQVGDALSTDIKWSESSNVTCDSLHRLYCFEI